MTHTELSPSTEQDVVGLVERPVELVRWLRKADSARRFAWNADGPGSVCGSKVEAKHFYAIEGVTQEALSLLDVAADCIEIQGTTLSTLAADRDHAMLAAKCANHAIGGWERQLSEAEARVTALEAERDGLKTKVEHLAKQESDIRAAYCLVRADNAHLARENKRLDREWSAAEASAKEARTALKPFADLGVGSGPDDEHDSQPYRILRGAIRRARSVLEG